MHSTQIGHEGNRDTVPWRLERPAPSTGAGETRALEPLRIVPDPGFKHLENHFCHLVSQGITGNLSDLTSVISSHKESQETSPTLLLSPRLTGNHRKPLQPRFYRLVTQGITGNLFEPRFCRLVSRGITGNLSDLASDT